MYNKFNTEQEAIFALILDSMQFFRDYNDNNGYIKDLCGSVKKFQELDAIYQDYLDRKIGQQEVLIAYEQNKNIVAGKWDLVKEGTDGKWYYKVYHGSLNSYEIEINPPFPLIEFDNA